jgi:hypothetical protein
MLVKTLERKDGSLFVEDELNRFVGICSELDFVKCMTNKEDIEIDGDYYFHVDKNKIKEVCKK